MEAGAGTHEELSVSLSDTLKHTHKHGRINTHTHRTHLTHKADGRADEA